MADEDDEGGGGAPAWMATFADLMSLLMCFFVLLLAFSEMDLQKYKQVAGSMREAFGVQRKIFAKETPMGTSFVAREFSPGKPDDSPINKTITGTTSTRQMWLDVKKEGKPLGDSGAGNNEKGALGKRTSDYSKAGTAGQSQSQGVEGTSAKQSVVKQMVEQSAQKSAQLDAEMIKEELEDEIDQGLIDIIREGRKVVIRIQEKGSFNPGSAKLLAPYGAVLRKVSLLLQTIEGRIKVAGHTDNVKLRRGKYRSNLELSAARSVSVVEKLLESGKVDKKRVMVEGYGPYRPLANNNSREGRALNRRVEIIIVKGQDIEIDDDEI
ncbi:MAG: hypothetical protein D6B27_09935 [Gammaproteobacteria bacterium]|nr:MAG: hypothetical protein D6B27_09935 [Gammaproteobacteria bacterium]